MDKGVSKEKLLENYECEGQMSIFDVDWSPIAKENPIPDSWEQEEER